ncbi:protein kinase [Streptomyces sp. NPDC020875]|uniref:protein kinase domain-containing protein n=1 Tax=Streptomyces sp. NPDC020875 TaxID=3154898 RepID=UPI0033E5975D
MNHDGAQSLIADRYLLVARLGSGGMGTVWRATDRVLKRTVAVKEVPLHMGGERLDTRLRRVTREARAIAQISHPHVIDIYDLVHHDDRLWLVMELVDGPSLAEHSLDTGPLPPSRVASIGLQLVAGLDAGHAAGVLHRDVKPANVLLRADGGVVLCDFGIAELADTEPLTASGALMGTLPFLAPERLTGGQAGPPSDLFALGCTLCALFTGHSPFARPEAAAVLHAVAHERPHIPERAGPLAPLLAALLAKDPADRPTAHETTDALRALAGALPTAASELPDPADRPGPPGSPSAPGPAARRGPVAGAVRAVARARALARKRAPDRAAASVPAPVPADGPRRERPGRERPRQEWSGRERLGRERLGRERLGRAALPLTVIAVLAVLGVAGPVVGFLLGRDGNRDGPSETAAHHPVPPPPPGGGPPPPPPRDGGSAPVQAVMPVPAGTGPHDPTSHWLFSGNQYLRVRTDASGPVAWEPLTGVSSSLASWENTLGKLPGFRTGIDASFRVPGSRDQHWVFSDRQYIRIRISDDGRYSDELVTGPRPITDWASAFGNEPGFLDGIDAVMPTPDEPAEFWVFAGDRYLRIELTGDGPGGKVLKGPTPLAEWTETIGAFDAFRSGIDAALSVPGRKGEYWVFSDREVLRLSLTDGTYTDKLLQKPSPLPDWTGGSAD